MGAMLTVALPAGYAVLREVRLYPTPERTGTPVVVPLVIKAIPRLAGAAAGATTSNVVYVADTTLVTSGRWYPVIVGETHDGTESTIPLDAADLNPDPRLVVLPEELAVRAKLPLPLSAADREVIIGAILDAQADVSGYLGRRSLMPSTYVQHGVAPSYYGDGSWTLTAHGDEEIVSVTSATPEATGGVLTGLYTVEYVAGINVRENEEYSPIRRYVRAHALNSPEFNRLWQASETGKAARTVRTVSAEGQSVTFENASAGGGSSSDAKPGSGAPGALPTLASLDRWRVAGRRVYQGPTRTGQWPYSGAAWPR
jgi:hypothetical protein